MNYVWVLLLTIFSTLYLKYIGNVIPANYALLVNFILMPLIVGIIGGWFVTFPLYLRIPILLVIPVVHVIYFGGDPAKPGLENLIGLVEAALIVIGILAAYFSKTIIRLN